MAWRCKCTHHRGRHLALGPASSQLTPLLDGRPPVTTPLRGLPVQRYHRGGHGRAHPSRRAETGSSGANEAGKPYPVGGLKIAANTCGPMTHRSVNATARPMAHARILPK